MGLTSLKIIVYFIFFLVLILVSMAFYTLLERKILSYIQIRKGPNKVSLMGLLQPFADAIKLFSNELIMPTLSNKLLFCGLPLFGLINALVLWTVLSSTWSFVWMKFAILVMIALMSLNIYVTFGAGWFSNSKYSMLGGQRSLAQVISYEITMITLLLLTLVMLNTMEFSNIFITNFSWPLAVVLFMLVGMWMISTVAETNRSPFDFAEGESELVSGFNTEYSSWLFSILFMSEYTSILFMSMLTGILFFPMFFPMNFLIFSCVCLIFLFSRGSYPRLRYDQLMYFNWKKFLTSLLVIFMIIVMML